MKLNSLIGAGLLGVALAAPAFAQSKDPYPRDPFGDLETQMRELDPKRVLGRTLTEADIEQFFAWMRASIAASMQGSEAPPPPAELRQKAESLSRELAARGALAGQALLNALEESARRALRDAQKQPPAAQQQRQRPPATLPGAI
jgi:hypothetical protein